MRGKEQQIRVSKRRLMKMKSRFMKMGVGQQAIWILIKISTNLMRKPKSMKEGKGREVISIGGREVSLDPKILTLN